MLNQLDQPDAQIHSRLTSLRLGIFFDGTGNNRHNTEAGRAVLKSWLAIDCTADEDQELMFEDALCEWGVLPSSDSYSNEKTNIAKLYALYDDRLPGVGKIYVEGVGTLTNESDDLLFGQALSLLETSLLNKVALAIQELIPAEIADQLNAQDFRVDGFSGSSTTVDHTRVLDVLELDVFGFSRGAAAARHFVNQLLNQTDAFVSELNRRGIPVSPEFHRQIRVKFMGLFDTVEAAPLTVEHLGVEQNAVERLVHLCAADEHRYYFPLTSVATGSEMNQLPANFTELYLPGAHSDIGGGYHSRHHYPGESDSLLRQALCLRTFVSDETASLHNYAESKAYQRAKAFAWEQVDLGWGIGVFEDMQQGQAPKPNSISLCARKVIIPSGQKLFVDVFMNKVTEGEYSRVPLRLMYDASVTAEVPLQPWDARHAELTFEVKIKGVSTRLAALYQAFQSLVSQRGKVMDATVMLNEDRYRQLRFEYLHRSDFSSWVHKPRTVNGVAARERIKNPVT